ncbi:hypothetical protein NJ7G_4218 [Natrinema sp. J7-2]|nr:hypothetical protein NJ7G_4218 [Natrinema sp. J7-2]
MRLPSCSSDKNRRPGPVIELGRLPAAHAPSLAFGLRLEGGPNRRR